MPFIAITDPVASLQAVIKIVRAIQRHGRFSNYGLHLMDRFFALATPFKGLVQIGRDHGFPGPRTALFLGRAEHPNFFGLARELEALFRFEAGVDGFWLKGAQNDHIILGFCVVNGPVFGHSEIKGIRGGDLGQLAIYSV